MEDLTLVIPAKYEKESLPFVLEELSSFNLKIIIVLEKTDYETIDSIKKYNCKILFQNGKGYGDALIYGINCVETEFYCIFNADGSFEPKELRSMYNLSKIKNFDLVFGSRYEKNSGSEDDTIVTLIGNKIFSFIGKYFFSLPISDILYTFVLGKTKKTQNLNMQSKDFCFCVELPIKALKNQLTMTSSVSYERKRIAGKKKVNAIKDGFKILLAILRLKLK